MEKTYTRTHYGFGDRNFSAVAIYSDEKGAPVAVEISNAGRSGSVYYRPDADLVAAATQLNKEINPGLGGHVASFARAVCKSFFHTKSTVPGQSTSEAEGANWAMAQVHRHLLEQNRDLTRQRDLIAALEQVKHPLHVGIQQAKLPVPGLMSPQQLSRKLPIPGR